MQLIGLGLRILELHLHGAILLSCDRQNISLVLDDFSEFLGLVHIAEAIQIAEKVAVNTHLPEQLNRWVLCSIESTSIHKVVMLCFENLSLSHIDSVGSLDDV